MARLGQNDAVHADCREVAMLVFLGFYQARTEVYRPKTEKVAVESFTPSCEAEMDGMIPAVRIADCPGCTTFVTWTGAARSRYPRNVLLQPIISRFWVIRPAFTDARDATSNVATVRSPLLIWIVPWASMVNRTG